MTGVKKIEQCSASCDLGEQTREAICVTTIQGSLRMVLEMNCPPVKPETRKPCNGPPCAAIWYTSDWTEVIKISIIPKKT